MKIKKTKIKLKNTYGWDEIERKILPTSHQQSLKLWEEGSAPISTISFEKVSEKNGPQQARLKSKIEGVLRRNQYRFRP